MSATREKMATREQVAEEALLGTRDGGSILVSGKEAGGLKTGEQAGGRLYTEDMPTLEDLLARYEVVTAVLHKPAPVVDPGEAELAKSSPMGEMGSAKLPFIPVLLLGGLPAATFIAGVVMLAGALIGASAVSNAYIGLLLFFGGLGLGVVAKIALHEEADV